jgi:hypothetical protein
MIELILTIFESSVFIVLSGIHFNWVFGGKFGFEYSIPTNLKGEKVLHPKAFDSAIVALGLLMFAVFFLVKRGLIDIPVQSIINKYGAWVIAAIFLLRAIGDFRYVGFFHKVKGTQFSKMDLNYFSPLCLIISLIAFYLAI